MSDSVPGQTDSASTPTTAGGLLRQARQARGLHIAALAAAIKVVPRKLELLEADQFDQLLDPTFTRALAQSVCRTLKIDPAPVLALLPPPRGHRLEHVSEGLNTPFREHPDRLVPKDWTGAATPALFIAGLLVVGAIVMYAMPAGWSPLGAGSVVRLPDKKPADQPAVVTEAVVPTPAAASAASTDATSAAPALETTPPIEANDAAPAPAIAAAGVLQLRPSEASWVEVIDAHGKPLVSRLVQAGESVGLDGAMPFKVRIGNANAMQAVFRGQPLELGPFTRDNIAKLELK
jgi:cytoskeleton protein RodZ